MKPEDIDAYLCNASNSTEALRSIYLALKKHRKSCSLALLCKKSGISSTGYLSDVFSGRRIVNRRYAVGIAKALGLSVNGSLCLRLLIEIDHERNIDKRNIIQAQLVIAQKALNVEYRPLNSDIDILNLFEALDVFCAFGLLQAPVTQQQIYRVFSQLRSKASIDTSLELLSKLGLIITSESALKCVEDHVIFQQLAGVMAPVQFIKLALSHAAERVGEWFPNPDQALFTSTVLSVKREEYERIIKEFKAFSLSTQSSLESKEGDTLIRFNIQVYPMILKRN
jgi:uncharacterized protein (TIGR02147 family)